MSRVNIFLAGSFLALLSSISYAQGMECDAFGISYTCPLPFTSREKSYCCPASDNRQTCCTKEEFFFTIGSNQVVLPVVLGVLALVVIFICCVCCACCRRKRERGAVYAVRGPSTVVQVNQNPPANYGQNPYPPTQPAGMPQPPPAYTSEVYSKQSPYNPNYPNP